MSERQMLRARRADKKDRLETLQMRASSMVAQVRRHLGGGYVEEVADLKVEKAQDTIDRLRDVVEETRRLEQEIGELDERING
jgi:hypothetical protein